MVRCSVEPSRRCRVDQRSTSTSAISRRCLRVAVQIHQRGAVLGVDGEVCMDVPVVVPARFELAAEPEREYASWLLVVAADGVPSQRPTTVAMPLATLQEPAPLLQHRLNRTVGVKTDIHRLGIPMMNGQMEWAGNRLTSRIVQRHSVERRAAVAAVMAAGDLPPTQGHLVQTTAETVAEVVRILPRDSP